MSDDAHKKHAAEVEIVHRAVAQMIDVNAKLSAACRAMLGDPRLLQIRRAHESAQPTAANPAWMHTHNDLGYVLRLIELLEAFK